MCRDPTLSLPGDELYEAAEHVCLLLDGVAAEGEDGVVDGRHHVQDLVEEVGHVLRRQVRRGGGGGLVDQGMFLASVSRVQYKMLT